MGEKGYRLMVGNKWIAVRRSYGMYSCNLYDKETDPNVSIRVNRTVAEKLKKIAKECKVSGDIKIIECGELNDKELEMNLGSYLTQKRIK